MPCGMSQFFFCFVHVNFRSRRFCIKRREEIYFKKEYMLRLNGSGLGKGQVKLVAFNQI